MTKKKKIIIGVGVGIVALAVTGTLLGVFLPPLFNKQSNIQDLEKNQVVPAEGNGNFLTYNTVADLTPEQKVQSINDFANQSLKTESGMNEYIHQTISNILVDFFQNMVGSRSYKEKFDQWTKDIDKSFDDKVQSYKDQYGDDWQYYFQLEVLDPVGGNEDDYKREQYFQKVNDEFDNIFKKNTYINLVDAAGNVISDVTEKDLFSDKVFNAVGQPCNIKFVPNVQGNSNFEPAMADLQSFVFDEYVKTKMPIVTSMVLFKHEAPATNGVSKYFDVKKATDLNGGTDPVGSDPSYIWQVFNPQVYNADGSWNATAKYNNFIKDLNLTQATNSQYSPLIWNANAPVNLGGAININTAYTDDSATLYLINANDVFSTSFTQYAAAAIYKLNNTLFNVTDPNVPTTDKFATGYDNGSGVQQGTEIMSNFFNLNSSSAPATYAASNNGYSFTLPQPIQEILNNDSAYDFTGKYNGLKTIADTVDMPNTPFILTRDEAGVHIIGIDRYDAIKAASTFDEKLTEIKNTLLWRYLLSKTKNDNGDSLSATTGFNIDLSNEIQTFYTDNRDELLIKYIIKKQTDPTTAQNPNSYIFSDAYSNMQYPMDPVQKELINQYEQDLFTKYYDYIDYKKYSSNNDTVKQKILGIQSNYVGKSFGNPNYDDAIVTNGIAGILPYTRNTANNTITNANGVYDNTYGMYDSVNWRFADGNIYSNITLDSKKTLFEDQVDTFLTNNFSGDSALGMKQLTFSTARYNQWLEVGNKVNTNTNFFASSGEKVNHAIFKWIDSSQIKNIVINQKIEQYINGKNAGINQNNNYLLSDKQLTNTPDLGLNTTIPTANDATATAFVNEYLQYARNIVDNVSKLSSDSYLNYGSWNDFSSIYNQSLNTTNANLKSAGSYTTDQQDTLKTFITLLYAFDYNTTTNSYDFTKFRDYLLNATDNYTKAAFVWSSNEKINYIQDYGQSLTSDFSFKPQMFNIAKNTFGYGYQGADQAMIQPIQDPTTNQPANPLKFANSVTFDDRNVYWNYVSPSKDLNTKYTGFLGMQFQGNTTSDLSTEASSLIFGSNAKYLDKNAPNGQLTYSAKGALYNIAGDKTKGMEILDKEIARIRNNNQKISMINWLNNNFPVSDSDPNKTQIEDLQSQAINTLKPADFIPLLQQLAALMIPDYAFTRVENDQLANTKNAIQQPNSVKYFGDVNNMASQVIVTQFNHDDVVELFNTDKTPDANGNQVIDDKDKGIDWAVAANKGFLGVGADAFFFSAYQWAMENSLYANNAYKDMQTDQGKINTYDRRLNNLFGEEWVENYKKQTNN